MAPLFTGLKFGFGGALTSVSASAALNTGGVSASGGAIYEYTDSGSTYRIHVFAYNSEPFVYTSGPGLIDVLVVGGGGAGGRTVGDQDTGKGGGGAGGIAWANQIPITSGTTCSITVGGGGLGSAQSPTGSSRPASVVHQSGSPSTFIIPSGPYTITGAGGGGGGVSDTSYYSIPSPNTNSGDPGGSGGGSAARSSADGNYNGGPATQPAQNPGMPWVSNYGFSGGGSGGGGGSGAGGGGGAGGAANPNGDGGDGTVGGPGRSTLGPLSASQTSAFLKSARIGTDPSNVQVTSSSPSVSYIGGGGGGAPGTSGSDWSTPIGLWGVGGGGRSGAGRNVGQTGPTASLLPNAYWPEVRGLEHTGGGGGGAADDPTGYTTGSYTGSGGKGVVVVRYSITGTSTGSFVTATGGSVSTDGDYKVHTFSHPNSPALSNFTGHSFSVSSLSNAPIYNTIEVLCVGGGGGGGDWYGAGGGGGGVAYTYSYPLPGVGSIPLSIPIQIGGGGNGVGPGLGQGYNGGDSYFGPASLRWTGLGGGGGGYGGSPPGPTGGNPGGSGGGGGSNGNPGIAQGGRSTQRDIVNAANPNIVGYNYGNAGGNGAGPNGDGAGGGGAGAAGSSLNGGNGVAISITGSSVTYGGGGGAATPGSSSGGSGGGGPGGSSTGTPGTDGLGGGGGGAYSNASSGRGGTGVVIVRYRHQ